MKFERIKRVILGATYISLLLLYDVAVVFRSYPAAHGNYLRSLQSRGNHH